MKAHSFDSKDEYFHPQTKDNQKIDW